MINKEAGKYIKIRMLRQKMLEPIVCNAVLSAALYLVEYVKIINLALCLLVIKIRNNPFLNDITFI